LGRRNGDLDQETIRNIGYPFLMVQPLPSAMRTPRLPQEPDRKPAGGFINTGQQIKGIGGTLAVTH
jgi:hypothetical protein